MVLNATDIRRHALKYSEGISDDATPAFMQTWESRVRKEDQCMFHAMMDSVYPDWRNALELDVGKLAAGFVQLGVVDEHDDSARKIGQHLGALLIEKRYQRGIAERNDFPRPTTGSGSPSSHGGESRTSSRASRGASGYHPQDCGYGFPTTEGRRPSSSYSRRNSFGVRTGTDYYNYGMPSNPYSTNQASQYSTGSGFSSSRRRSESGTPSCSGRGDSGPSFEGPRYHPGEPRSSFSDRYDRTSGTRSDYTGFPGNSYLTSPPYTTDSGRFSSSGAESSRSSRLRRGGLGTDTEEHRYRFPTTDSSRSGSRRTHTYSGFEMPRSSYPTSQPANHATSSDRFPCRPREESTRSYYCSSTTGGYRHPPGSPYDADEYSRIKHSQKESHIKQLREELGKSYFKRSRRQERLDEEIADLQRRMRGAWSMLD